MNKKILLVLTITILLFGQNSRGQANLSTDLSLLFGNLPMHLPAKKIISIADKNSLFKGSTHYNLDISYSGRLKKTEFFKLKPGTCFILIVSDAREFFIDTIFAGFSYFTFDAGFSIADTTEIINEYDRIGNLFSKDFPWYKVERKSNRIDFYKKEMKTYPTLSIQISQDDECYAGKRCIKFSYFNSEAGVSPDAR